jgi:type VI secretion system secreted protein VgrG
MVHAPGKIEFKASKKELEGPSSTTIAQSDKSTFNEIYNQAFVVRDEETGKPMAHVTYRLETEQGVVVSGITDAEGRTQRVFTRKQEVLKLFLLEQN